MTWTCHRDEPVPGDVARLLATVPEWFGREESNAEYVDAARTKETWTVRDGEGTVVGVTLLDRHFPESAEVFLTVVDRAHHGQGIGTAMVAAIEADLRANGVRLLQVKTLGASDPDESYARTRHFYESVGFLPLEETDLWGEDTPCLFMVKPLAGERAQMSRPSGPDTSRLAGPTEVRSPDPALAELGPLGRLVGYRLVSVEIIVNVYVQFRFDLDLAHSPVLTLEVWPVITHGGREWRETDLGYADSLRHLTTGIVQSVSQEPGEGVRIELDTGVITINPSREEVHMEIGTLAGFTDDHVLVWLPGEPPFEHVV